MTNEDKVRVLSGLYKTFNEMDPVSTAVIGAGIYHGMDYGIKHAIHKANKAKAAKEAARKAAELAAKKHNHPINKTLRTLKSKKTALSKSLTSIKNKNIARYTKFKNRKKG